MNLKTVLHRIASFNSRRGCLQGHLAGSSAVDAANAACKQTAFISSSSSSKTLQHVKSRPFTSCCSKSNSISSSMGIPVSSFNSEDSASGTALASESGDSGVIYKYNNDINSCSSSRSRYSVWPSKSSSSVFRSYRRNYSSSSSCCASKEDKADSSNNNSSNDNSSNNSNNKISSSSSSDSSRLRVTGQDSAPKINEEYTYTSKALEAKKAHDSALGETLLPNLYEDTFGPDSMRVSGYGDEVFEINGVLVESSVVVLPGSFFYWDCRTIEDISMEKLLLFKVLYPKPDVLLIGCGTVCNPLFNKEIINQMNSEGIVVEFLSSPLAAATFNVLNAEGRSVALCLVTLVPIAEQIDAIV